MTLPDSGVQAVGGGPEWKAQRLARAAKPEYKDEEPDSARPRVDAPPRAHAVA